MKYWWLIEKGVNGALEAQYLTLTVGGSMFWGHDANAALKFATKEDADKFGSDKVFSTRPPLSDEHSSVEHGFDEE